MRLIATREGIAAAPPPPVAARRGWLKRLAAGLGAALLARPAAAGPANITGADPYIGEIMLFAGTFAPENWAFCNGQSVSIADYSALFQLIGTTYGGDGQTTFNLPDLRSRLPRHVGTGPGLSPLTQGQTGGNAQVVLTTSQLPAHIHTLSTAATASSTSPASTLPAPATGTDLNGEVVAVNLYTTTSANNQSASSEVGNTGSNQPVPLTPATLSVNYCIALQGNYPSPQ